uniref:Uncharacterized protein n=1 Tax=Glossina austeni TaxID=7395 RepID=A0A1A9VLR0_GLOAU
MHRQGGIAKLLFIALQYDSLAKEKENGKIVDMRLTIVAWITGFMWNSVTDFTRHLEMSTVFFSSLRYVWRYDCKPWALSNVSISFVIFNFLKALRHASEAPHNIHNHHWINLLHLYVCLVTVATSSLAWNSFSSRSALAN